MTHESIQRVRIYLSEHDRWQDMPLYSAVLERLQREGATGATVLQGLAGFGPGQRIRAAGLGASSTPVVLEWIDRADRIARTLPMLDDMLPNAMITLEDVQVYQAVLRARGPLADERSVGDMTESNVQTVPPTTTLGAALELMLEHHQDTLPVLDAQQHIVGVLTEQELVNRVGLRVPLDVCRVLSSAERAELLHALEADTRPVSDVMFREPRSLYMGTALPQALVTMIEWNYRQIPVTRRDGSFAGLLSADAVLQFVAEQVAQTDQSQQVRDAEPPTSVQLVMQRMVPRVHSDQGMREVLHHMQRTASRYVVVVDEERRLQGSASDTAIVQQFSDTERRAWIHNLHGIALDGVDGVEGMPTNSHHVASVMQRDMPTLAPDDSMLDAARLLVSANLEWAPVIDSEGTLIGALGRSGLLRALTQENL